MTESKIQSKILKYLKGAYPSAYIVKISDRFISGIPDILMIEDSYIYFFEVKTPRGRVSKIQEYTMDKIQKAGGNCYVVRSVEDVRGVFI